MQGPHLEAKAEELRSYPAHCFSEPASPRWLELCSALGTYEAPWDDLALDSDRKWELTSGIQKAIRRADKATALKLISGIASIPGEYTYFLRRMCVIACEDIGPADDTLVRFTIACATLFSARRAAAENHRLLCFLAEQMCDLLIRSRVYCSCETISLAAEKGMTPALSTDDLEILAAIARQKEAVQTATSGVDSWQRKNNWRSAGMLKFVGFSLPLPTSINSDPLPRSRIIFDLPSYCYDVHTRIGLAVLRRLLQGVNGAEGVRGLLQRNCTNIPHKVLGEALFTIEGGREKSELLYPALCSLEQRMFAYQFGLPFDEWLRLCDLTRKALEDGVIDRLREEILSRQYGQKKLQLVC